MIRYLLACESGHSFDSWFPGSSAYEEQAARALVSCPVCRSTQVTKAIMAPAISTGLKHSSRAERQPASTEPVDVPLLEPRDREIRALLKTIRDKVIGEGQDVGARFPDEARRMHDGKIPVRQIYGQASLAEACDLLEEGIVVLPLPTALDDLN